MLILTVGLVIGILIGWSWPQPPWARDMQSRFVRFIRSSNNRLDR